MPRVLAPMFVLLALGNHVRAQSQVPTPTTAETWGRVTRTDRVRAEFSLNTRHGLWGGERVWVYRRDGAGRAVRLGPMVTQLVDDRQAVGKADAFLPKVGDYVLFQKPVPVANSSSELNALIGSYIEVTFSAPDAPSTPSRALVLDVVAATDDDIRELWLTFPSLESARRRLTYDAKAIRWMRAGTDVYTVDPATLTLAKATVVAGRLRERERLARLEAERRRQQELARLEARRHEQQRLARLEAERQELQRREAAQRALASVPPASALRTHSDRPPSMPSGRPDDAAIQRAVAKILGATLADSIAKDQDQGEGLMAAVFSVTARAGRDLLIDSALKDLFLNLGDFEIRGIRRVVGLCLDGEFSLGNLGTETAREEIIRSLKKEDPTLGDSAQVVDFLYELQRSAARQR